MWFGAYESWDKRFTKCLRRDRKMFRFGWEWLADQVLKTTRFNLPGVVSFRSFSFSHLPAV